ncbi:MAG TPA: ornithine cyclodeaminase family protein [Chloroflexota bacterium]
MLVLKNADMADLVSMGQVVSELEIAYAELGRDVAKNAPRARLYVPAASPDTHYFFNNIMGAVPGSGVMALRIDSSFIRYGELEGRRWKEYPGDFVGLVLLFDLATTELVAMLDDHYISTLRVGGTSGVGARYLAREDAATVGLFGSGAQARTQLEAMCAVRPVRLVRVFSPTQVHREQFAAEMSARLEIDVQAVADPTEAVRGLDIVVAATNAVDPLFPGDLLEPGQHVVAIVGGDASLERRELESAAVRQANVKVVNSRDQAVRDRQPMFRELVERGEMAWDDLAELAEVAAGSATGRQSADHITLHHNNTGMGIQFAAIARCCGVKPNVKAGARSCRASCL